ncbi:MAG TPA: M48 family metallopeptidase [Roseimicrobium sp.]|nr:M48 family metallopeptidase [Roseimicrobium sp.]
MISSAITTRLVLCCLALVLVLTGCTTVSETGRRQFNVMSPGEEMQLGFSEFDKMKTQVPISKDAAANELLQRVGKRIAAVAQLPDAAWEFVVFESKEANAFCLPGGKVGVYTGILPITKDEGGLATVIGHEVAHAVARHGGERVSHAMGIKVVGEILSASTEKSKYAPLIQQTYGLGAELGLALPHSRKQESEADYIGLLYMARAGYDPEAAVAFWERFGAFNRQAGGAAQPWFLRTHPLDATRVQQLKDWLPKARLEYRAPGTPLTAK